MTRARELRAAIRELPVDGEWNLSDLKLILREAFGFDRVGLFRPQPSGEGVTIELEAMEDFASLDLQTWRDAITSPARDRRPFFFDVASPEGDQRNEVISLLNRFGPKGARQELFRRIGIDLEVDDITRVVLCEGDEVLMWLGGTSLGPLAAEHLRDFTRIVPDLRARFAFEQKLRAAAVATNGLGTVLATIAAPAFIVRRDGAADHANDLGARLRDRDPRDVKDAIASAIASFEDGAAPPSSGRTQVTRLGGAGVPRWLVILHDRAVAARIAASTEHWGLTARQRDVLIGIVAGHSNKAIARRLKCSEATVEAHATAIYRKAHVEGRAALIAKFLSGS